MCFLSHFVTQKGCMYIVLVALFSGSCLKQHKKTACTCTCSFILRLSSPGVKYRIYMYMRGENRLFLLYTCTNPTCIFQMSSDINGPGAKVRVITREARYYMKTCAFVSCYAIITRAHAARGCVTRHNFARSRVKVISARQFKGVHERCVKAALEDPAQSREFSHVSMVNAFEV